MVQSKKNNVLQLLKGNYRESVEDVKISDSH